MLDPKLLKSMRDDLANDREKRIAEIEEQKAILIQMFNMLEAEKKALAIIAVPYIHEEGKKHENVHTENPEYVDVTEKPVRSIAPHKYPTGIKRETGISEFVFEAILELTPTNEPFSSDEVLNMLTDTLKPSQVSSALWSLTHSKRIIEVKFTSGAKNSRGKQYKTYRRLVDRYADRPTKSL